MPSRRLGDRIRELCTEAANAGDANFAEVLCELQTASAGFEKLLPRHHREEIQPIVACRHSASQQAKFVTHKVEAEPAARIYAAVGHPAGKPPSYWQQASLWPEWVYIMRESMSSTSATKAVEIGSACGTAETPSPTSTADSSVAQNTPSVGMTRLLNPLQALVLLQQ